MWKLLTAVFTMATLGVLPAAGVRAQDMQDPLGRVLQQLQGG